MIVIIQYGVGEDEFMNATTRSPAPSLWQRMKLWMEAVDEAAHLTEADVLLSRINLLEARIDRLETQNHAGSGDAVRDDDSPADRR